MKTLNKYICKNSQKPQKIESLPETHRPMPISLQPDGVNIRFIV